MRGVAFVSMLIIGVMLSLLLGGCATISGPTPFEIGAESPPPMGCIQGRARGVDC